MRSQSFIIGFETQRRQVAKPQRKLAKATFASLHLYVFALIFSSTLTAQRVAILTPDKVDASRAFAEKLESALADNHKVVDDSLSETAYRSVTTENPFNLTTDESRRIGAVTGCEYFVLVRAATLRRSSTLRSEYYESHAIIYAISSRTGRLVFWRLEHFEAGKVALPFDVSAFSSDPSGRAVKISKWHFIGSRSRSVSSFSRTASSSGVFG